MDGSVENDISLEKLVDSINVDELDLETLVEEISFDDLIFSGDVNGGDVKTDNTNTVKASNMITGEDRKMNEEGWNEEQKENITEQNLLTQPNGIEVHIRYMFIYIFILALEEV